MTHTHRFTALVVSAAIMLAAAAHADVVTSLNSPVGQVGQPLQLQYQFVNVDAPQDMPRTLNVPGLDIRLTGTSRRVEIVNFQSASSMIYAYTVIPNQPGNFTIPGFAVQAGGRQVRTDSVNLRVTGPGGSMPPAPSLPARPPRTGQAPQNLTAPSFPSLPQGQSSGRSAPRGSDGGPAAYYGEIVMGAKSAYVGEVVPVELRFYFRADNQFDNLQRPSFGGEGFTAAPLSEPEQTEQYIDDVPYNIVTFRSAITPVKSGDIEIPAAVMEGRMMSAGGAPSGMDPFFDQFFRNLPMPGFGQAENIQARTSARKIEVLPLPKEGRPENFSGAIGQFTLDASASPRAVKAGEPVTLKLSVEGRGNFDAIAPPVLTATDGWRAYAPKENFKGADAIGYGGTKTFEISMVARTDQAATPAAEFSYFDPLKKKYVTLKTEPVAVTAVGGGAKAGETADSKSNAVSSDQDKPLPPVAGKGVADIAAPAAALARYTPSFEPWLARPWFMILNAAVLVAIMISIPWLVWLRRRAMKSERTAALEMALRAARGELHSASDRTGFYAAAAQFVQTQLALWDDKPAGIVDPSEALSRRVQDTITRRELESIISRRDELKYGGGGSGSIDAQERRHVVELLEKFSSTHV